MPDELNSLKLDIISTRLEKLEGKLEGPPQPAPTASSKAKSIVELIGIPTAILALLLQFTSYRSAPINDEKVAAETSKIRTEELKTRAELQGLLNNLQKGKGDGIALSAEEADALIPQIRAVTDRLDKLGHDLAMTRASLAVAKGVLIVCFLFMIQVLFAVFGTVTAPFFFLLQRWVLSRTSNEKEGEKHWWHRTLQPLMYTVIVVPGILRTALNVFVLALVVVPYFNAVAAAVGAGATLEGILRALAHLQLGQAVSILRDAVLAP